MTTTGSETSPAIRVGFAGLGTMGAAMAANLARAGFELRVWNRTPGRAEALVQKMPSILRNPNDVVVDIIGRVALLPHRVQLLWTWVCVVLWSV